MPASTLNIRLFDLQGASDYEYQTLNRHLNRFRAEKLPDDPPRPLEEMIAQAQNLPVFISVHLWAGWDAGGAEILASASVTFHRTEENTHMAQFVIAVDPPYRRQGVGRELLRLVAEKTRSEGRRLMIADTHGRIPAGDAFMERLGAERGLVCTSSQLVLSDLDRTQIDKWLAEGRERASGLTLGVWDGPYPDDQLEAIAALIDVMNTQPSDNLDVSEVHTTPEQLRQQADLLAATGTQRWTVYATETATGRFAGSTEVYWNPNRPQIVNQGMTGVFLEFRGRGLGRWLKAAMLDHILHNRPEARFVRTDNANSNAAVLSINEALGYKSYSSLCFWQLETEKALAYLEE